ncbi:PD-(D/E)XK nuclease family protein [Hymenobacter gummosus]|nr:PD-(D/E)XK nuclease family protein [Hymenobacter gummosus]
MTSDIQPLLDQLEPVRVRRQISESADLFNIFRILRSETDEVHLHSRFIYELLDPQGSHGLGSVFLRLFADVAELPGLHYEHVQVWREHANIDILIRDAQQAIVIENKIYAGDQHEQLKRYHAFAAASHRQPTLCYLTLHGSQPSEWSLGDLQSQVRLLSYQQHIDQWLTSCIKEAATRPTLRETLSQYQTLIRHLTGNNMSEEEKQEVLRIVAKHDNAEKAAIIARNWKHVRWHAEWDFWNDLLALVSTHYAVASDDKRFNTDYIDKAIHGRRNREFYYGLSFRIGSLTGQPVNLRLERDAEPIYYGIPYGAVQDTDLRARMFKALQPIGGNHTQAWPTYTYTNPAIDFEEEAFGSSQLMMQMINPDKRQCIISQLFDELESMIKAAHEALQQEFGSDFEPAIRK